MVGTVDGGTDRLLDDARLLGAHLVVDTVRHRLLGAVQGAINSGITVLR